MPDHNIATPQYFLKQLEEEIKSLNSLMSQLLIVVSNMKGTWTGIANAQKNWKRDIEKH